MKKIMIPALALFVLAACNSSDSSKEASKEQAPAQQPATTDISSNPDYQKGLAIEASQNCATCHKIDEKVTGPAYQDIAAKYAGAPDTIVEHLAKKVIAGGSGVWGQVPMIAHPELSLDSAKAIVKYILLLKK
ncbi:MAG TPA: c-type cytochrome [Chitinophagaceae bacterium]|nr:c-type cytochrome [Chitinophagaceae bacterium]